MRHFRVFGMLFLVPVLAFLLTTGGCGGGKKGADKAKPKETDKEEKDDDDSSGDGKPDTTKARTELDSKGWGTLKGRVTLVGDAPKEANTSNEDQIKALKSADDRKRCHEDKSKDSTRNMVWKVKEKDGKKVVQNVVVFLVAPKDKYFKLPDDKSWTKEPVSIDQPFCAFEPRVQVVFPSYYDKDTKKLKASGQKFIVKNSAPINHNTKWRGEGNPGDNKLIPKDGGEITVNLNPASSEVTLHCSIHPFMTGKVWAFDHPYAAVTDADGNYEIKNVPAGVEVAVVVWHEGAGYVGGKEGKKMTFEDKKETEYSPKIEPKK